MLLEDAGFEAFGYGTGAEFLTRARPGQGDVVLLDIDLPDLNGTEVASILKQRHCKAEIAVISGLRATAYDECVRKIAPMASFRKPLNPDLLIATLTAP